MQSPRRCPSCRFTVILSWRATSRLATSASAIRCNRVNRSPLYCHSPSDRDRVRPLVRLLITIIVRRLTEEMDYAASGAERQRLLLMLDEFANLGRLEVMEESLAYLARLWYSRLSGAAGHSAAVQDLHSRDETILSHCHIRAAFAPNKLETAQWLSQQTGESTVVKERSARRAVASRSCSTR